MHISTFPYLDGSADGGGREGGRAVRAHKDGDHHQLASRADGQFASE